MLPPESAAAAHNLLDHAKRGDFDSVRRLLRGDQSRVLVNWWRPGGTTWFTSLHQAAWHGVPADIAQELVTLGAWRALRTHAGDRALDIAIRRRHTHLVEVLTPPQPPTSPDEMAGLTKQLAELVACRASLFPVG